jgi:hypothetical protein
MFTLRIWVFKSGVLKKLFILSKHVTYYVLYEKCSLSQVLWESKIRRQTGVAKFLLWFTDANIENGR